MRWPEFLEWTQEERRAVLAVLLFTGGGGLILELGRRFPDWTPDLLLVASLDRHRVVADSSVAVDTLSAGVARAAGVAPAAGDTTWTEAGLGGGASVSAPGIEPSDHRRRVLSLPVPPAGPVDINRATAEELTQLPGVGPKLAERIVVDRVTHGRYRSVADLDRVKGVGPSILQKIAGKAVVGDTSDSTSINDP